MGFLIEFARLRAELIAYLGARDEFDGPAVR